MKMNGFKLLGIFLISAAFACNSDTNKNASADSVSIDGNTESSYVNLSTGEPIQVVNDTEKGYYIYSDTKLPVDNDLIFVNVSTRDTLYGRTGALVNNAVLKSADGAWILNDNLIERDGDKIKIKTADGKLKIDGDELKYKEGNTKIKVDGDESKIKTEDSKTKTDGAESKYKTDDTKVKVEN